MFLSMFPFWDVPKYLSITILVFKHIIAVDLETNANIWWTEEDVVYETLKHLHGLQ